MLESFKPYKLTICSPSVSITNNGVTFNNAAVVRLGKPSHVVFYISENKKQIALQPCDDKNPDATKFLNLNTDQAKIRGVCSVRWNYKELLKDITELMGWDLSCFNYNAPGAYHIKENIIIFDLAKAAATNAGPPAGTNAKDA